MAGRPFTAGLVFAAALFGFSPARAGDAPVPEAAVKATYLYKFAPFVTWPDGAGSGPLNICIVGADPFGDQLDRAVAGQAYNGRPFQVVRMDSITAQASCAVAFLGGSRSQTVATALKTVHGAPILTVTDEGSPAGIIAFEMQDDRVRFRIDEQAAEDGGMVISSKLLGLALSVRTQRGLQP